MTPRREREGGVAWPVGLRHPQELGLPAGDLPVESPTARRYSTRTSCVPCQATAFIGRTRLPCAASGRSPRSRPAVVRGEHIRLGGRFGPREPVRRGVLDPELLAGLGVLALEDGGDLLVVLGREPIERQVQALLEVRATLGNLLGRDPRRREPLRQVDPGEQLERARIRDLVHAAAHQQVAGQRACRGMLDQLVDLELAVACAGLEEVVVREVLDEVARREHVVARPRSAVGVDRQHTLAALEHVMRIALREHLLTVRVSEHRADRGTDGLDVPVLLGRDVGDEVVERPQLFAAAEVERLERVVHQRRHLAEAAAHQLLDGHGAGGVRIAGWQLEAETVVAKDHGRPLLDRLVRSEAAHQRSRTAPGPIGVRVTMRCRPAQAETVRSSACAARVG